MSELTNYIKERIAQLEKQTQNAISRKLELQAVLSKIEELSLRGYEKK